MQFTPATPYSLRATMGVLARGTADPALRMDADGLWWCVRTPTGEGATVRLRQQAGLMGTVHAWAWGPGADYVEEHLPTMIGFEDDWSDFDDQRFQESLPVFLRQARRSHPGLRLTQTGLLFDQLTTVVLEQKVTHMEARYAWRYLLRRFGEKPPGPAPAGMKLPLTAQQWAHVPSWEWHQARVDGQRSRIVLQLAQKAATINRIAVQDLPQLRRSIRALPGVGPWTAAEVLQRTHADPDSVSVGDYHLANHVVEALTGVRGNDRRMLEVLSPWVGQRHRVVRMIGLSSFRPSRFGPKLTPEDHRAR
ncbi:DNA-3-methyladenine glycosylase family protein [Micrococcoides hystricis]|uniref:DNA-3-methyladenine glycosylase family protein n=1 Tax=Micrococcoides hystricis TaxID=1572761 RepID=A0ABV6P934_9MICC